MAFNDAISDMLVGRIDYAVIGGASNIFRPQTSLAFQRLQMLSPEVSAFGVIQITIYTCLSLPGLHCFARPCFILIASCIVSSMD